jgi:hypothetical protein
VDRCGRRHPPTTVRVFLIEDEHAPKLVGVVAAMATVAGPAANLGAITELGEDVGTWLRQYDGYRGVFVFVDKDEQSSRVITLWDTAQDELAARQTRGAMRDRLMAMAGLEVVSFHVYEVAGHEYLAAAEASAEPLDDD